MINLGVEGRMLGVSGDYIIGICKKGLIPYKTGMMRAKVNVDED